LDTGRVRIEVAQVRREDWAESWKRHFHPIEIGRRLLIKPTWSKRRCAQGQRLVMLDPGLSFGTGHHPTTRYCLERLVLSREEGGASFLDLGSGSGILSIAAVKLGFKRVDGVDFDPEAVRVAGGNSQLNRVADRLTILRKDIRKATFWKGRTYDCVCANLTYDILLECRDRIVGRVARGGTLVLAGILRTQFTRVVRAYEAAGWVSVGVKREQEWQSGAFRFLT
jgi:ribosomal protein L11 methyltransferase